MTAVPVCTLPGLTYPHYRAPLWTSSRAGPSTGTNQNLIIPDTQRQGVVAASHKARALQREREKGLKERERERRGCWGGDRDRETETEGDTGFWARVDLIRFSAVLYIIYKAPFVSGVVLTRLTEQTLSDPTAIGKRGFVRKRGEKSL